MKGTEVPWVDQADDPGVKGKERAQEKVVNDYKGNAAMLKARHRHRRRRPPSCAPSPFARSHPTLPSGLNTGPGAHDSGLLKLRPHV